MRARGRRVAVLVLVLGFLVAAAFGVLPYQPERATSRRLADAAAVRVRQGMTLADAEQALGDAWHHAECDRPGYSEHLFLFGSRDLDQTGVVYVRAEGPPTGQVVTQVSGLENHQLFLYDDCSPLDLSTTRGT